MTLLKVPHFKTALEINDRLEWAELTIHHCQLFDNSFSLSTSDCFVTSHQEGMRQVAALTGKTA